MIKKTTIAALALTGAFTFPAAAHHSHPSTNIVQAAAGNDQFETLVSAVTAADLAGTLSSEGPFTVFAPTDAAFAKLPEGTVGTLVQPENKGTLTSILTYHVVAGNFSSKDIVRLVKKHGGSAALTTVQGGKLTASLNGGELILTDEKGNRIAVTSADLRQSNGVIHVIDGVLMP